MNSVLIIGNLTRDPELKRVGEYDLVNFAVAVNDGYGDRKKTFFFDCSVWGKKAKTFIDYCKKGNKVSLTGKLEQQTWETSSREKRSKIIINCNDFDLLTPRDSQSQNNYSNQHSSFEPIPDEEDMPF